MEEYREVLTAPETPHFFGCWTAIDQQICNDLISFFEESTDLHQPGYIGRGRVDANVKNSTDIQIKPDQLLDERFKLLETYFERLHACFADYCKQWEFLGSIASTMNIGTFNMQRYDDGGHFFGLHSEKINLSKQHRALVWMTYLNDVPEGGETEFTHYDLKVIPKQGRTLIWPAEWTHAHRGCPVPKGPKYIITGWLNWPYAPKAKMK